MAEEMASALDARRDHFTQSIQSAQSERSGFEVQNLTPEFSMLIRTSPKSLGADRWRSFFYSWAGSYADFIWIRDSGSPLEWARLLSDVQFLISNDQDRVLNGANFGLDHEAPIHVLELEGLVQTCFDNSMCIQLNLPDSLDTWARTVPYYLYRLDRMSNAVAPAAKREALESLRQRLEWDSRRFRFHSGPSVRRISRTEWSLTLSGDGIDSRTRHLMERLFEEAWSDTRRRFRLEWSNETLSGLFRFILEPEAGGRAYVSRIDSLVHLFPRGISDTFQHEMGHVL